MKRALADGYVLACHGVSPPSKGEILSSPIRWAVADGCRPRVSHGVSGRELCGSGHNPTCPALMGVEFESDPSKALAMVSRVD